MKAIDVKDQYSELHREHYAAVFPGIFDLARASGDFIIRHRRPAAV